MSAARDHWSEARAQYEAGKPVVWISMVHNIKIKHIRERAAAEGWAAGAEELMNLSELQLRAEKIKKRAMAGGVIRHLSGDDREDFVTGMVASYITGVEPSSLRKATQTNRNGMHWAMFGGVPRDLHFECVSMALVARLRKAEKKLSSARDEDELALAKRMVKTARMHIARHRPELYADMFR